MNRLTIALSVLGAILLGVAGVVAVKEFKKHNRRPTIAAETDQEREASTRSAFNPASAGDAQSTLSDDPELTAEMQSFFEELGRAYTEGDAEAIKRLVSLKAMFAYVEESGLMDLSSMAPDKRDQYRAQVVRTAEDGFVQDARSLAFSDPRVMRIEVIREGEVTVWIKFLRPISASWGKARFWLLRGGNGAWYVYDNEDLHRGIRMTAVIGSFTAGSTGSEAPPWMRAFIDVSDTLGRFGIVEDAAYYADLLKHSSEMLDHDLPAEMEAPVRMMRARAYLFHRRSAEALADLVATEKLTPNAPVIFSFRGDCLKLDREYVEALENYQRYCELLGWEASMRAKVAECHVRLGERDEALAQSRRGLEEEPRSVECLATLALALPEDELEGLRKHLFREGIARRDPVYEKALYIALDMEDRARMKALLSMFKEDCPDNGLLNFFRDQVGGDS